MPNRGFRAILPLLWLAAVSACAAAALAETQGKAAAPAQAAPQRAAPPSATIKVQVNQVLVPVVVTDKRGHSITGLKAGDFEVYEDGQPQRLTAFSTEEGLRAGTLKAGGELSAPAAAVIPSGAPQRTYLICLDTLNSAFENLAGVRSALNKLFKQEARRAAAGESGGSQYALVALGRQAMVLQDLTRDPQKIMAALDDKRMTAAISHGENGNLAEQESELSQFLANYCQRCPCNGQAAATGRTEGGSAQVCNGKLGQIEMWANSAAQERSMLTHSFLDDLKALVARLAQQPGKRDLVFISDGFNLRPARDLFGLIAVYLQDPSEEEQNNGEWLKPQLEAVERLATARNVTFYTLDSKGLQATPSGGFDASQEYQMTRVQVLVPQIQQQKDLIGNENRDAMAELAAATGGLFYRNNNDLFRGLRQAFEDGRAYYLLAYDSPDKAADGKFREIRVEVQGKGYVVRAKHGYWAPGP